MSGSLPAPGSPTFVPALLAYIQSEINLGGEEWSIDPSLFSALLLSQIVGIEKGGIIVDVLPNESGEKGKAIIKVVENVQAISQSIFGLTTHHVHLSRHTHPSELSGLLFSNSCDQWISSPSRQTSSPSVMTGSRTSRQTSLAPSSRYTSALASPIYPRSRRGTSSLATTPGITPKNSLPLLIPNPNTVLGGRVEKGSRTPSFRIPTQDEREMLLDDSRVESPKLPQCLILSGLERAESAVWAKLSDMLLKGYVEVDGMGHIGGRDDAASSQPDEGDTARKNEKMKFPDGFWVIWVRDEDRSEKCPPWLIDHFSSSICIHPDDLDSSPSPITQRTIIPTSYIKSLGSLLPYTHIHPPLLTHISNLLSGLSTNPHLRSAITARALTLFPEFIKAHRIISAPFKLPAEWIRIAETRQEVISAGKGVAMISEMPRVKKQDEGWVDTWGMLAGEEPDFKVRGAEGDDARMGELDCQMGNIEAIFGLALRHRICWREERGQVMWLLKGSAVTRSQETNGDGSQGTVKSSGTGGAGARSKRRERRRRREVDLIMEDVLASV